MARMPWQPFAMRMKYFPICNESKYGIKKEMEKQNEEIIRETKEMEQSFLEGYNDLLKLLFRDEGESDDHYENAIIARLLALKVINQQLSTVIPEIAGKLDEEAESLSNLFEEHHSIESFF